MRLWHSKLISLLDGKRLCDTHMSCCNLRGKGWGKRNVAINYLYDDPLGEDALVAYHQVVLEEMERRGFDPDAKWWDESYCGKNRPARESNFEKYEEACMRNIPLLGHTVDLYFNDVKTLQERGLKIELWRVVFTDRVVYVASNDEWDIKYEVTQETYDAVNSVISETLKQLGISPVFTGYQYLRSGLRLLLEHPEYLKSVSKRLWPKVAAIYDTTYMGVDMAVRKAITTAWDSTDNIGQDLIFGNTISSKRGSPSVKEFLSAVFDYLRNNEEISEWL